MEVINFKYSNSWYKSSMERGIDYAFKSLHETYNRMGTGVYFDRFMRIVIGEVAQSAIDTYLEEIGMNISHNGKTRWYEIDKYDLSSGNYQFDSKATIKQSNPMGIGLDIEEILNYSALVPKDQFAQRDRSKEKLNKAYIFPVVELNYDHNNFGECIGFMPWDQAWWKPPKKCTKHNTPGTPLNRLYNMCDRRVGNISFSHNGAFNGCKLKIYGTNKQRSSVIEELTLNSNKVISDTNFFQLFGIRLFSNDNKLADSDLVISSDDKKTTCSMQLKQTVEPKISKKNNCWNNLYTSGDTNVYLGGFITKKQMQVIGQLSPRFDKQHAQYPETKTENLFCSFKDLNPLRDIASLK